MDFVMAGVEDTRPRPQSQLHGDAEPRLLQRVEAHLTQGRTCSGQPDDRGHRDAQRSLVQGSPFLRSVQYSTATQSATVFG